MTDAPPPNQHAQGRIAELEARVRALEAALAGQRTAAGEASPEQAVTHERQLLATIVAHIPSGVYWKDRQFRYGGCNEAFAHSAGVARPEDIIGRTDYELAWEKSQTDYFRSCDRRVMEEGRPMLNIEEVERQADGRQAILLTSKVPLRDDQGQVWGVLGIDTDISELKRVEEELRRAQAELETRVSQRTAELAAANEQLRREVAERTQAEERYRQISELTSDYAYALAHVTRLSTMGELAGQLAHELNQPLCSIVGNAQTAQRLLNDGPAAGGDLQDALADIAAAGKHAGQVIRRLRDFLRAREPSRVPLDIQPLIQEIAGFLESDARRHGAALRFELAEDLPAVSGDPTQIQQVIVNLVRNALEAMEGVAGEQREVLVAARPHAGRAVAIIVADRGPGLSLDQDRVFEPFVTTKPDGLGLGLSISRTIVEAHGGQLWVEPRAGGGAIFGFSLPGHEEQRP